MYLTSLPHLWLTLKGRTDRWSWGKEACFRVQLVSLTAKAWCHHLSPLHSQHFVRGKQSYATHSRTRGLPSPCTLVMMGSFPLTAPASPSHDYTFWPYCVTCRILLPNQGWTWGPWQWESIVLTTAPPGNSLTLLLRPSSDGAFFLWFFVIPCPFSTILWASEQMCLPIFLFQDCLYNSNIDWLVCAYALFASLWGHSYFIFFKLIFIRV